jgi:hypothetical protein
MTTKTKYPLDDDLKAHLETIYYKLQSIEKILIEIRWRGKNEMQRMQQRNRQQVRVLW